MPLRKLFLTAQAVNPRFLLDVPLVMTFIKDKVRYGLMASLSISAQQRQSHIYLPPSPNRLFVISQILGDT